MNSFGENRLNFQWNHCNTNLRFNEISVILEAQTLLRCEKIYSRIKVLSRLEWKCTVSSAQLMEVWLKGIFGFEFMIVHIINFSTFFTA